MKPKVNGNCYQNNMMAIWKEKNLANAKLVHGVAINSIDKEPMGHCWIETDDVVFDYSTGKQICVRKESYYKAGNMPVKGYKVYKYTRTEVLLHVTKYQTYGPWEQTGCKR